MPHAWRYEAELYTGKAGVDLSAKAKYRRWRNSERVWGKLGTDGRLMLAVWKDEPDRALLLEDVEAARVVGAGDSSDQERHRELEVRLRTGPYLGDGMKDQPWVRFPLTLDEWDELTKWREAHGWGEGFGTGALRTYWRTNTSEKMTRHHRLLPTLLLAGRALG